MALCVTAQAAEPVTFEQARSASLGAAIAPAVLPAGGTAFYGMAGVPSVSVGYRQGIAHVVELEALFAFDYFRVSFLPQVGMRVGVLTGEAFELAAGLRLGLSLETGARYLDAQNFGMTALRLAPLMVMGYRVAERVKVIGALDVPLDVGLSVPGGRYAGLFGPGAEIALGEDFTAVVLGQLGFESAQPPALPGYTRLGYAVRLGFGFRLF
jgi:hypothetical protein